MRREDGGRKTCSHDDIALAFIHCKSFHSISPYFSAILKIKSVSVSFAVPRAWWGLHKISCLTGRTCLGGNTEDPVSKESRHSLLNTHPPPPISPSNNTRSDREERGLFKIAAPQTLFWRFELPVEKNKIQSVKLITGLWHFGQARSVSKISLPPTPPPQKKNKNYGLSLY